MDHFNYQSGQLLAEEVPVNEIAQAFGTPCYIYSRATLERHWRAFDDAFAEHPHLICYAVKANPNLAVLNVLARLGAGFDVVSVGELERVIAAGGDPKKIVFSGVGKQTAEIKRALALGVYCLNVESEAELFRIEQIARQMNVCAPVALRINPDVDAKTHPYIATGLKENKFGIDVLLAAELYRQLRSSENIQILGIDCHIGSQLTELAPFLAALERVLHLVDQLREEGVNIHHVNLGGGLGVRYRDEEPPHPSEHAKAIIARLKQHSHPCKIILEPGRAIAANAGILVTRVEYLKTNREKHFAIVDAGMNDLLRPALYDAWQAIIPVSPRQEGETRKYDIVGPVCETGDFLGKQRELIIQAGDLLAVRGAGAYSYTMSSNYNSRPRAAEVMVDGKQYHLIRRRETIAELFAHEQCLPSA